MLPVTGWLGVRPDIIGPVLAVPMPEPYIILYGDGAGITELVETRGHVVAHIIGRSSTEFQVGTDSERRLGMFMAGYQPDAYGVILIDTIEPDFDAPDPFIRDRCERVVDFVSEEQAATFTDNVDDCCRS